MRLLDWFPVSLPALLGSALLSACPYGSAPSPPPSVPKPKLEQAPEDATKLGRQAKRPRQQVQALGAAAP